MKKIERIARQFRNALDAAWEDDMFRNLYPFNNFPNDCCGHTCDLLSQYLLEHGIETRQVNGTCRKDNEMDYRYNEIRCKRYYPSRYLLQLKQKFDRHP